MTPQRGAIPTPATKQLNERVMFEQINDLLNRYELGVELLTAYDVANELQDILDDENRK